MLSWVCHLPPPHSGGWTLTAAPACMGSLVRDPGLVLRTACCLRMSVIDFSQPFVVRLLLGPRALVYRPRGLLWQSHERPVRLVVKLSASDVRPPLLVSGSQGQLEVVGA